MNNYYMNTAEKRSTWVIWASFILAFILTILPLPNWANWLRPEWIALVLISWILLAPNEVGLGSAWISGLILDVLGNTTLGEHALILTIVAYSTQKIAMRIKFFPFWQKSLVIFALVLLAEMLQFWLENMMGRSISNFFYWLPAITTTLFWPWVVTLFEHWRD